MCEKNFDLLRSVIGDRDGIVSIATSYGLDGPGFEPRWWARFPGPVHTGPEAHPVSYTMGTWSPSRG
jgi:hypothetical protein